MKHYILAFVIVLFSVNSMAAENTAETISWRQDLDSAISASVKNGQLLILDFYADWCPPCQQMEKATYSDKRVIAQLQHYTAVKIDVDKSPELAKKFDGNPVAYGGNGIPTTIVIDSAGNELVKKHGYLNPDQLISLLAAAEKKHRHSSR